MPPAVPPHSAAGGSWRRGCVLQEERALLTPCSSCRNTVPLAAAPLAPHGSQPWPSGICSETIYSSGPHAPSTWPPVKGGSSFGVTAWEQGNLCGEMSVPLGHQWFSLALTGVSKLSVSSSAVVSWNAQEPLLQEALAMLWEEAGSFCYLFSAGAWS